MLQKFKRVLVPVDFSEGSRHALLMASEICDRPDAELTLLHVYQMPGLVYPDGFMPALPEMMSDLMFKIDGALSELATLAKSAGAQHVRATAVEGSPHIEILRAAESADLIVMGTHGFTGLRHALFGSVAENVVRRAICPVLTARQPDPAKRSQPREPRVS